MNWLSNSPVDRLALLRSRPEALRARWESPDCRVVPVVKGRHPAQGETPVFLNPEQLEEDAFDRAILLGELEGRTYFALDVDAPEGCELLELRRLGPALDLPYASLLAQARAMTWWHRRTRHCGACGEVNRPGDGGHRLRCPTCEVDHHPRVDPAVIVLVEHEGACLLARSPRFPPGMMSTLAGFVEPGESLEDCVVREVHEEVGVTVADVAYHSSQPWPFPQSLMVGFHARARSRDLNLDREEIEAARWIERDVLADPARWEDFSVPPPFTIARQLMQAWLDGATIR